MLPMLHFLIADIMISLGNDWLVNLCTICLKVQQYLHVDERGNLIISTAPVSRSQKFMLNTHYSSQSMDRGIHSNENT